MTIICPIHGEFTQKPNEHLSGHGCRKCGYEKVGQKLSASWKSGKPRKTTAVSFPEFLDRAHKVHGKKYRYIEASYTKLTSPVTIICPVHGEFRQNAQNHVMQRHGCPKCGLITLGKKISDSYTSGRRSAKNAVPFNEFLDRANKAHGNKYQYIESSYTRMKDPLTIICPVHGEYRQCADNHVSQKQGCPKCGLITLSKKISALSKSQKTGKKNISENKKEAGNGKEKKQRKP